MWLYLRRLLHSLWLYSPWLYSLWLLLSVAPTHCGSYSPHSQAAEHVSNPRPTDYQTCEHVGLFPPASHLTMKHEGKVRNGTGVPPPSRQRCCPLAVPPHRRALMALSALSGDEAGIVFSQLCNALEPCIAVAFGSISHGLRERRRSGSS